MSEYDNQSDSVKVKVKRILDRQAKLASERATYEPQWQEAFDYIIPRKAQITTTGVAGEKRGNELFDTTAIMANQYLAGALHGMLTNPAVKFFELMMDDPALNDEDDVQVWLQDTGDRMFSVLNGSNFQTEVHEFYLDLGCIGNAGMFMAENEQKVVHFHTRPTSDLYVDEDNLGSVDVVHRVFKWKARNIIQEFGVENVPEIVRKKYEKGSEDEFCIIHAVYPIDDEKPYFKYASCYVLSEEKVLLHEGGFPEFPYAIARWTKTSGEKYGRGPGTEMLPDIKMLNVMMETTIKGAQLTVSPPLMVTDDGVIGKIRLTPTGLTVVRPGSDLPIRPLITDARIDFGYQAVEDVRKRIRSGFYVDQLQLNDGPQMTATEVMQRTEEKLRLMGPVLGRQHFEFLRVVIDRLFAIMTRKQLLLPPPPSIENKSFSVRYSSLIAKAQRMSEGQNLMRAFGAMGPLVQTMPDTLDNVDGDKAFRYIMDIHGVPQKIIRDSKEIKDMRSARAQAQQEAINQQREAHAAQMVGQAGPAVAQLKQAQAQMEANK